METTLITLNTPQQHLECAPDLGASVTRWDWRGAHGLIDALHPPGRSGLVTLTNDSTLRLRATLTVTEITESDSPSSSG